MIEKERDTKPSLDEDDEPIEWSDEMFARAQISVGGRIVREATGTLTKRGRPPVGAATKQQVTLRLAPEVIAHFRAMGAGWQTRINEVLERHVSRAGAKPKG
jgi:uncharacterized protein (DUF4415 family)